MIRLPLQSDTPAHPEIAYDCRHFLGDRPCLWHKREKLDCTCEHYAPVRERVLIIKLDAMGDVLRTTALLPALAQVHPQAAIDWVTRPEAVPLLENNPYLSDVIPYGTDTLVRLLATPFDRVINLDAGKTSAGLATLARAPRKDGYVLHEKGYVSATNPAAQAWLEMGVSDELKRRNRRTYQDIMLEILDLPRDDHHYVLELTAAERAWARQHLERLGIEPDRPVVGLNLGAGGRWQLKRWRLEGFTELCEQLHARSGVQLLLLGGKAERERNAQLMEASAVPVLDAGCDHDVRRFAALAGRCDVVVTGDTLAMHVALAVGSRAVVLFGPTSAPEIELYGQGEKVYPAMECLGCYKTTCDFVPNCMDLISVDMVTAAVLRQLPSATRSPAALAQGIVPS